MARKPTGRPNGRPPKTAQAIEAIAEAERTGAPVAETAKRARVGRSTAFRAKAKRRAAKGAGAKPRPAKAPQPPSPPVASPAGPQAPAFVTPTAAPLDRLRAYAAHDPGALAALEALVTPGEGLGRDELSDLLEGLRLAADVVRTAGAQRGEDGDGPLLRALQRLEGLAKAASTVKARRPAQEGPGEVARRFVAVADAAAERMRVIVGEEAAAFDAARDELGAWLATLGPIGAEAQRRVDAMLDGEPA
jgi:hypothetical protein